jgi:hypothetical protein
MPNFYDELLRLLHPVTFLASSFSDHTSASGLEASSTHATIMAAFACSRAVVTGKICVEQQSYKLLYYFNTVIVTFLAYDIMR